MTAPGLEEAAGRLKVRDSQDLQAADQGLIISEDGEISSDGYGSNENINGTALDAVVKAEVEQTGSLKVVIRRQLLVEEWRQGLPCPEKLTLVPDSGENLLADDADDGDSAAGDCLLEFDHQPPLIAREWSSGSSAKGRRPNTCVNEEPYLRCNRSRSRWRIFKGSQDGS